MRSRLASLAAPSLLLAAAPAAAATLTVGSGQMYATPCAAIAAAQPNDEVDVYPGTYTDTCSIAVAGLTLKGVNGQPKIDLTGGTPYGEKAIYVIDAAGVTIENLEMTGATIDPSEGENGAAIRIEAQDLTVRGCYIHDNQDGILGSPLTAGGTLLVEGNEFSHNGMGNGCDDGNGCTHNLYIGANVQTFTFQYNWTHNLATDTPDKGHLLKTRAQQSYILYNRITGEDDTDSYEIDVPQAGLAVVVGNMVEKPPMSGNGNMLSYGEESMANADHRIFVVNNTFVNDKGGGQFLNIASGGTLVAHNNVFAGTGTPSSTGALSADNLSGKDPLFVSQATFDYHLMAGSPAIGIGVSPGSADMFSLVPVQEYVQALQHVARTDMGKTAGAFEYPDPSGTGGSGGSTGTSTVSTGAGTTSTTSTSSAGTGGASATSSGTGAHGSGAGTGGSSGSGSGGKSGSTSSGGGSNASGGCHCELPAQPGGEGGAAALVAAAALLARRRRRLM
jgi:MYXO-CTERM domain-containing protein